MSAHLGEDYVPFKKGSTDVLLIQQFTIFMQNHSIGPCHLFIGDDPQPLTGDELNQLIRDFKAMIDAATGGESDGNKIDG